jgi:hypothetical protein
MIRLSGRQSLAASYAAVVPPSRFSSDPRRCEFPLFANAEFKLLFQPPLALARAPKRSASGRASN